MLNGHEVPRAVFNPSGDPSVLESRLVGVGKGCDSAIRIVGKETITQIVRVNGYDLDPTVDLRSILQFRSA
jgi:hypothetical protein